jgi:hypothetical protein
VQQEDLEMIGTAQGRLGASRTWLAALAVGIALAFGAGSAVAAERPLDSASLAKKDGSVGKAASLAGEKDKDKDKDKSAEKGAVNQSEAGGLDAIKSPETRTGDERKKP